MIKMEKLIGRITECCKNVIFSLFSFAHRLRIFGRTDIVPECVNHPFQGAMHPFDVRAEKWFFLPLNQIPENRGYYSAGSQPRRWFPGMRHIPCLVAS
jgi:hypothetical protein